MVKLERLQYLRSQGALSDHEFEKRKAELLARFSYPKAITILAIAGVIALGTMALYRQNNRVAAAGSEAVSTKDLPERKHILLSNPVPATSPTNSASGIAKREYHAASGAPPEIARVLRDRARESLLGFDANHCEPESCYIEVTDTLIYKSPTLMSFIQEQSQFDGGAHPYTYIYDLNFLNGKPVRFGNLFTSWQLAKPIIQSAFCKKIRAEARAEGFEYDCPDIERTALTFVGDDGSPNLIRVFTSDSQLGFWGYGRTVVDVPITPQLEKLLKI